MNLPLCLVVYCTTEFKLKKLDFVGMAAVQFFPAEFKEAACSALSAVNINAAKYQAEAPGVSLPFHNMRSPPSSPVDYFTMDPASVPTWIPTLGEEEADLLGALSPELDLGFVAPSPPLSVEATDVSLGSSPTLSPSPLSPVLFDVSSQNLVQSRVAPAPVPSLDANSVAAVAAAITAAAVGNSGNVPVPIAPAMASLAHAPPAPLAANVSAGKSKSRSNSAGAPAKRCGGGGGKAKAECADAALADKRRRNKIAAQKCREKRLRALQDAEQSKLAANLENSMLKERIKDLEAQVAALKAIVGPNLSSSLSSSEFSE